jgi:molecular chaperone HscB
MIDFSRNHFELFGLPARFRCDTAALDRAYRTLQTEVHPDRFAAAGEGERRNALQSSARVNEAYRALKDPVSRAQYLLSLRGIDALAETDTALAIDFLNVSSSGAKRPRMRWRRAMRGRSTPSSPACTPRSATARPSSAKCSTAPARTNPRVPRCANFAS